MVWAGRDRGLWLMVAVLTLLLGILAFLQYRWTHEIGRAEAERRQGQLDRAARRFASALERALGQTVMAFWPDIGPPPADRHEFLLQRLEAWQSDENAALVTGLLLASRAGRSGAVLEEARRGDIGFRGIAWPEGLVSLRQRLEESGSEPGRGPSLRPGAVLERPLALLVPFFDGDQPGPGPGRRRLTIEAVALLELDADYIRDHLLPRLAETHFGPPETSEFVAAVLRRADRSVFYTSDPTADVSGNRRGDVELSLPGHGGRPGPPPEEREGPPPGSERPRGRELRRPPPDQESPWLLVARHRGGSLEQTVARLQRRNLAVGFGVLALLGVTAVMLAASAQRARRLARQQLEFVAGVTHELNTPLAAIRSAGQNLVDGIVTDPGQVRRYGGLIEKEGGRLTALVAQVLDFAGIESGNRVYASEPLALAVVIDEVLRDHRLVLEQAGMQLEKDVAVDLPELRGDAAALRRMLANLVANAAKFAASGGWLAVRASVRPDGRAVVLRVEDRGPGIPREERERVFEPFYRGPAAERNDAPGGGLGLGLVRHVVRAHGGSVRVEAREGGGAAIVVELPVGPARETGA
jgi:signal transduction histidine kinase